MRGSLIRPLRERIKNVSVMHILGVIRRGLMGGGGGDIQPQHIILETVSSTSIFMIFILNSH